MAEKECLGTIEDHGIKHKVRVPAAESVYVAAALGLAEIRRYHWAASVAEGLNPTQVTICEAREVSHSSRSNSSRNGLSGLLGARWR